MYEQMEIAESLTPVQRWDWNEVHDQQYDIILEIYNDYKNGVAKQYWPLINTNRLAKILLDYAYKGYVRDEIGTLEIAQQIIDNVARIYANTILCGHAEINPIDYMHNYLDTEIIDEEHFNAFTDEYLWDDKQGCYRISDYGLGLLCNICNKMTQCVNAEQLLALISEALNVYHQRSNLSTWLVEGGQEELCRLSNLELTVQRGPYMDNITLIPTWINDDE
jgi:hypothetical protein